MSFEEFQNCARLHAIDALEDQRLGEFEKAREEFGDRGEEYIDECQKLGAAFALSLQPRQPEPNARERLMSLIQRAVHGD